MSNSSESIISHLQQEHKRSTLQTYLKEIVYGGNDGIVTTFAVVAGFTGAAAGSSIASYSILTVLLFGLANLFADGASMGLGNFLSLRSEQDAYKTEAEKELQEIKNSPEKEKGETMQILQEKGFSKKDAQTITNLYATNENYWLSFMMNHELELPNPMHENPIFTGIATFLSFAIFGTIPLLPYMLLQNQNTSFFYSLFATFGALVLLGILRFKITEENPFRSVFEIVAIGGTAASIAYFVGTFFKL